METKTTEAKHQCTHEYGHDWEHIGGAEFSADEVAFPQKCNRCGLEALEIFTYSCVVTREGERIEE